MIKSTLELDERDVHIISAYTKNPSILQTELAELPTERDVCLPLN